MDRILAMNEQDAYPKVNIEYVSAIIMLIHCIYLTIYTELLQIVSTVSVKVFSSIPLQTFSHLGL